MGWCFLWMSGFQIEKHYPYWQFIPAMFLSGIGSACTGDWIQVRSVRAQGTTLIISFILLNIIAIYDKYKKNLWGVLILGIFECLKVVAMIIPTIFTQTGDYTSACVAILLGFGFGWGFLKNLDKCYSATRYFVWRRFQIFTITFCVTFTVVMLTYSWFMYYDRNEYESLKNIYMKDAENKFDAKIKSNKVNIFFFNK